LAPGTTTSNSKPTVISPDTASDIISFSLIL
jgi:hypothetical protein